MDTTSTQHLLTLDVIHPLVHHNGLTDCRALCAPQKITKLVQIFFIFIELFGFPVGRRHGCRFKRGMK